MWVIQTKDGNYIRPPGYGCSHALTKKKAWKFWTKKEAKQNCGPDEKPVKY